MQVIKEVIKNTIKEQDTIKKEHMELNKQSNITSEI